MHVCVVYIENLLGVGLTYLLLWFRVRACTQFVLWSVPSCLPYIFNFKHPTTRARHLNKSRRISRSSNFPHICKCAWTIFRHSIIIIINGEWHGPLTFYALCNRRCSYVCVLWSHTCVFKTNIFYLCFVEMINVRSGIYLLFLVPVLLFFSFFLFEPQLI